MQCYLFFSPQHKSCSYIEQYIVEGFDSAKFNNDENLKILYIIADTQEALFIKY